MAYYETPVKEFTPHPNGTFEGRIVAVEDKGEVETPFGTKPKLAIKIESETETMEDGRPFSAWLWVTLSGSPKSNLYKIRTTLLGRDLTADECGGFEDSEVVDRRVGYQIVHREGKEGLVFANVSNIWPLKEAEPQPATGAAEEDDDCPF